jgi:ribosome maturation factor RimP
MARFDELREEIYKRAVPICTELGIEIVEVNIHAVNDMLVIQVFADKPAGGIGLEECTALNQRLDKILYDEMKLGDHYTLEVSSPGLDRPLLGYRDFRRVIGRNVHLFLKEPVRGKREIIGELTGLREGELILQVKTEEWLVPTEKVEKGKQIVE